MKNGRIRLLSVISLLILCVMLLSSCEISIPGITSPSFPEYFKAGNTSDPRDENGLGYILNADGKSYTVYGGECQDKNVVIPATFRGLPVKRVAEFAFLYTKADSYDIPEGVTHIGTYAFYGCKIGDIHLPDSIEYIAGNAFAFCKKPKTVTYDNAEYAGNEENPYLFLYAAKNEKITSCEIHPDTRYIGENAFRDCKNLTSITIPDGVKGICRSAFFECETLTEVKMGDSVTFFGKWAFSTCSELKDIRISSGIKYIDFGTFNWCYSLKKNQDGDNYYLGNETEPYLVLFAVSKEYSESRKKPLEINSQAHAIYCLNTTCSNPEVIIPADLTSASSFDGNCFGSGTKQITVDANNPVFFSAGNCLIEKETGTIVCGLSNSEIPQDENIRCIGTGAFSSLYFVRKDEAPTIQLIIPDNITEIELNAFSINSGLLSVVLPEKLTCIHSGIFSNCSNLKEVTIPVSVTYICGQAFAKCTSLEKIIYKGTMAQWKAMYRETTVTDWDMDTGEYTVVCTDGTLTKAESR